MTLDSKSPALKAKMEEANQIFPKEKKMKKGSNRASVDNAAMPSTLQEGANAGFPSPHGNSVPGMLRGGTRGKND